MSEVALQALRMVDLAVDCITFACQRLCSEVAMLAFADLSVYTVAKAAPLWAIRNVADGPIPAEIALANVWRNWISMLAGRVARRNVARCPFISIEADACLRGRAHAVFAVGAYPKCTNCALPPFLADAGVRADACAKDTRRVADRCVTVDTCPTVVALTALTLVPVI